MINIKDISGVECWINPNYIVTTKEENYTPTNEFGIKQNAIHCWNIKMVNGDEVKINDKQMKALIEPIVDKPVDVDNEEIKR